MYGERLLDFLWFCMFVFGNDCDGGFLFETLATAHVGGESHNESLPEEKDLFYPRNEI